MIKIFPSLIAANPLELGAIIKQLEPHCAGFHLDVMDNHFVPNLTFGANIVNEINEATRKPNWVHLMVDDPEKWCDLLQLKAGSIVSFHFEATDQALEIAKCISEKKWIPSIAINPKTNAAEIFPILDVINHVLLMSVQPGFSGQRFIPETIQKVAPLLAAAKEQNRSITIGMDGGINAENIKEVAQASVQDIAIASAIFSHHDSVKALEELESLVQAA